MNETEPVAVVRRWQEALNRGDHAEVLRLSSPEIEIEGPRGTARGRDVLRQWLESTRVTLDPRGHFAHGEVVVAAQEATWRSPETGAVIGRAEVASVFRVARGLVSSYARHETLEGALAGAGLSESDRRSGD